MVLDKHYNGRIHNEDVPEHPFLLPLFHLLLVIDPPTEPYKQERSLVDAQSEFSTSLLELISLHLLMHLLVNRICPRCQA